MGEHPSVKLILEAFWWAKDAFVTCREVYTFWVNLGTTWRWRRERKCHFWSKRRERESLFTFSSWGGPLGLTLVHKGPRAKPLCPWLAPLPTSLISCACQACLACFPWIWLASMLRFIWWPCISCVISAPPCPCTPPSNVCMHKMSMAYVEILHMP